jgi:hypothetical protein
LTPVSLDDSAPAEAVWIELPAGWCRVWRGFVLPGDRYLHLVRAAEGVREWVPLSFADLLRTDDVYDSEAWFGCLIREGSRDVGSPCPKCGVRAVDFECDDCGLCDLPAEALAAPEVN